MRIAPEIDREGGEHQAKLPAAAEIAGAALTTPGGVALLIVTMALGAIGAVLAFAWKNLQNEKAAR